MSRRRVGIPCNVPILSKALNVPQHVIRDILGKAHSPRGPFSTISLQGIRSVAGKLGL